MGGGHPTDPGVPCLGTHCAAGGSEPRTVLPEGSYGGRTQTVDASPSGMGRGCGVGGPKGGHVEGIRGLERVP